MSTSSFQFLTKRRVALAAVAGVFGCVACCAVPLLAAAGLGGGGAAAIASMIRPGSELIAGGGVFLLALSAMAIWARLKGGAPACSVDGSCRDDAAAHRSA